MAEEIPLGIGLDIGTMNLVSARRNAKGKIETSRMRDAFLDLDLSAKKRLKLAGVNFIERPDEEQIVIVGDEALEMANLFGRDARRPLSQGLISAGEMDALEILGIMIQNVLGEPEEQDEVCYFSVPAPPVDADRDVIYHKGVFERIVRDCGYEPFASNEAMALIFNETAKEGFSGLAISFGAGMCNIALALNGMEGMTFSVARGGDWLDAGAAKAVGSTQSKMCAIKEKGFDLENPQTREQQALALYYRELITYCIKHIRSEFKKVEDKFTIPKPIPIIISGGTSLAGGFLEFFIGVLEKGRNRLPFEISEIRYAKEPLSAVAQGLLVQAMQEYD